MLPTVWCNVSSCQAMDAQPQRLRRPEFSPLHHCNTLTTSGTKTLWRRDKTGAKVFLAEKQQEPKSDPMTLQSDHTLPLRKHFHSVDTFQSLLFPKISVCCDGELCLQKGKCAIANEICSGVCYHFQGKCAQTQQWVAV